MSVDCKDFKNKEERDTRESAEADAPNGVLAGWDGLQKVEGEWGRIPGQAGGQGPGE